ncbi:MAG: dethiobiotin synthase [Gammaproteobacteria bacterium]|nr:dethiobiotin synthase [Gammaproteobacteria bacterium]MDH5777464.1 dethiobiotin synthase [Gammaproteobacteria bacterium]
MTGIFITGTDTGIGKTYTTVQLIQALQSKGVSVAGMKPIASGAELIDGQLRNDDALQIQLAMKSDVAYELINPYCFISPVSPHIAAQQAGVDVDLQIIKQNYQQLAKQFDVVLVEGVGGWLAPISAQLTVADLTRELELPIVLVVGIRLGCLNHAALAYQSIQHSGSSLSGWIANVIDPETQYIDEQIEYLSKLLGQKPFAQIGHSEFPDSLNVDALLDTKSDLICQ